jgi:hypothetical protein
VPFLIAWVASPDRQLVSTSACMIVNLLRAAWPHADLLLTTTIGCPDAGSQGRALPLGEREAEPRRDGP